MAFRRLASATYSSCRACTRASWASRRFSCVIRTSRVVRRPARYSAWAPSNATLAARTCSSIRSGVGVGGGHGVPRLRRSLAPPGGGRLRCRCGRRCSAPGRRGCWRLFSPPVKSGWVMVAMAVMARSKSRRGERAQSRRCSRACLAGRWSAGWRPCASVTSLAREDCSVITAFFRVGFSASAASNAWSTVVGQARQGRFGRQIAGILADHGGVFRAADLKLRLGRGQERASGGQLSLGLRGVGARHLAHLELGVGLVELAGQDVHVVAADADDLLVAPHVLIGLDHALQHARFGGAQTLATRQHRGLRRTDAGFGAAAGVERLVHRQLRAAGIGVEMPCALADDERAGRCGGRPAFGAEILALVFGGSRQHWRWVEIRCAPPHRFRPAPAAPPAEPAGSDWTGRPARWRRPRFPPKRSTR